MKKNMALVLALTLLTVLPAQARGKGKQGPGKQLRACKKVNLTKDQRKMMRSLRQEQRLLSVDLRADLQKAKLKRRFALLDGAEDLALISDKNLEVAQAQAALRLSKLQLQNKILMEVLEKEQRRPMLRCMKQRAAKKMRPKLSKKGKKKKGNKKKSINV